MAFKFYLDAKQRQVICVGDFGGKSYRAVAKCAPEDRFDIEIGKQIALDRCKYKIARAKVAHAQEWSRQAGDQLTQALRNVAAAGEYKDRAYLELQEAFAKIDRSKKK